MHALIVVSHPDPNSLTHSVAARIGEGIAAAEASDTVEIADLSAEGFDPRFSQNDFAAHRGRVAQAPDVLAEQARIDRADALVLGGRCRGF